MLVLDSTVLIAALDSSRSTHHMARGLLSREIKKAVTTQTMRESLAVATRNLAANGLGIGFSDAMKSMLLMRMACDRLLHETESWWTSYMDLAQTVQPSGRSIYDLGQVAHVRCLGPAATLVTDDQGLVERYRHVISVVTISDLVHG